MTLKSIIALWVFVLIMITGCGENERVVYIEEEINEVSRSDGESIALPQNNITNIMTKEDVFIIELDELTDTMVQIDMFKDDSEDNDISNEETIHELMSEETSSEERFAELSEKTKAKIVDYNQSKEELKPKMDDNGSE